MSAVLVVAVLALQGQVEVADAGVLVPTQLPAKRAEPSFFENNFSGTALMTRTPFLYEASFVVGGGGFVHAPGLAMVPMTGISVKERSGLLSAILIGLLGNALQGLGSVRIDSVTRVTSRDTYERNGTTYERLTTETTTTYTALKTQEQLEREQKEFRESTAGMTWMDLTVYADNFLGWNRGSEGGNGYEFGVGAHFELFALLGLPAILDVGFYLANLRIKAPLPFIGDKHLTYAAGGLVGRLHLPLTRFATLSLEWVLNALSIEYLVTGEAQLLAEGRVVSSPLKLGLELYATDFVVFRAQAVLGGLGFTDGRLGLMLSAGVRL